VLGLRRCNTNDWAKSVSYLLSLAPPASGETDGLWRISYRQLMIQSFLVDAETIWNHPVERWVTRARIIEQPQETLLRGLGLASRLYARLHPAWSNRTLHPVASLHYRHMSFKVCCPRFEDSGLGVVCQVGKSGGMGRTTWFENLRPDTARRALGAAEPAEL